jgi:hypothetical protein
VCVVRYEQGGDRDAWLQASGCTGEGHEDANGAMVNALAADPHAGSGRVLLDVEDRTGHAPILRVGAARR